MQAFRSAGIDSEIIVIVDLVPGDETISHARKARERFNEIRVLERRGKRGVGDAVRAGITEATGEIVVPVMADGSEDPFDIVRLVTAARDCDIVFTDRFEDGKPPGAIRS